MRQAAIAAGFIEEHIHLRLEPAAAAISYARIAREDANVLVYDFGGGTFDACLLKLSNMEEDEPEIAILSTYGDNQLGGNDLDKLMMDMIYDRFFLTMTDGSIDLFNLEADDGASKKQKKDGYNQTLSSCKPVKRTFVHVQSNKSILAPFLQEPELINLNLEITREAYYNHKRKHRMDDTEAYFEAFEGLCAKDLVSRTLECVDKCLDAASMAVSDIDQIFLVGGSSAVPEVVGQVKGKFDKEPYKSKISPALSISQGAAYYCNMIMLPSSKGPKVLDQTVHPLGLEIAGRRFLEVIPKV